MFLCVLPNALLTIQGALERQLWCFPTWAEVARSRNLSTIKNVYLERTECVARRYHRMNRSLSSFRTALFSELSAYGTKKGLEVRRNWQLRPSGDCCGRPLWLIIAPKFLRTLWSYQCPCEEWKRCCTTHQTCATIKSRGQSFLPTYKSSPRMGNWTHGLWKQVDICDF